MYKIEYFTPIGTENRRINTREFYKENARPREIASHVKCNLYHQGKSSRSTRRSKSDQPDYFGGICLATILSPPAQNNATAVLSGFHHGLLCQDAAVFPKIGSNGSHKEKKNIIVWEGFLAGKNSALPVN